MTERCRQRWASPASSLRLPAFARLCLIGAGHGLGIHSADQITADQLILRVRQMVHVKYAVHGRLLAAQILDEIERLLG